MLRPVLLGGRTIATSKTFAGWLVRTWLPVMIMLFIMANESTSHFSSEGTSPWMRVAFQALFGPVQDAHWPFILHAIRKSGHFLGYGTLALTWLRGWLLFWHGWLRRRPLFLWRGYSVLLALASTAVIASLDELHQSFLPDRTGLPQDVVLDCCGGIVLMALCALFWLRRQLQTAA